jgi:hypothetical protein
MHLLDIRVHVQNSETASKIHNNFKLLQFIKEAHLLDLSLGEKISES